MKRLCPICGGGCGSCDDSYCRRCKNKGEVPAICDCGEPAEVTVNDRMLCRECAERESEDAE